MSKFIEITDDGDFITSKMPHTETVVEVRLRDGNIMRAWYDAGIQEAGDFDFIPVGFNNEPNLEADSIADKVVAWRPLVKVGG